MSPTDVEVRLPEDLVVPSHDPLAVVAPIPEPLSAAPRMEAPNAPMDDRSEAPRLDPVEVPNEFWDSSSNQVRVDELVFAYKELLALQDRVIPVPAGPDDEAGRERLLAALGRPTTADAYELAPNPLFDIDTTTLQRFHRIGLNQQQAQDVCDLAAEMVVPALDVLAEDLRSQREIDRLAAEFGGRENFARLAAHVRTWAKSSLDEDVYATLSTSADGVLALVAMMRSRGPTPIVHSDESVGSLNEAVLHDMIRDPRYWRDRDPDFVSRVTRGFAQLYAG